MNLFNKIKKKHVVVFVMVLVYSFVLIHIVQTVSAASAEPGTDANPLVAQDYVDAKITERDCPAKPL